MIYTRYSKSSEELNRAGVRVSQVDVDSCVFKFTSEGVAALNVLSEGSAESLLKVGVPLLFCGRVAGSGLIVARV